MAKQKKCKIGCTPQTRTADVCEECAQTRRVEAHALRVQIQAKEEERKRSRKQAEPKKKWLKKPRPPAERPAPAEPRPATVEIRRETPPIVKISGPPPPPRTVVFCSVEGCSNERYDRFLCVACCTSYRMWSGAKLRGSECPVILNNQQLWRFEAITNEIAQR